MDFTTIKVPGADALQALEERRDAFAKTGEYPFLIGDANDLERVQEAEEYITQDSELIIRSALTIDVDAWFIDRRTQIDEDEEAVDDIFGIWPDEVSDKGEISMHKNIVTQKTKKEVFIGLAKIREPWQLPAVVKFGGWNECPDSDQHCAVHRRWFSEYGAEIVGISGDIIECKVARPPKDRNAAIKLAWQQYWYCSDIVDQGVETVSQLAATLLDSDYWFFWWD